MDGKKEFEGGNKVVREEPKWKQHSISKEKPKAESSSKGRNRDLQCWKCQGVGHVRSECPNKRTMMRMKVMRVERMKYPS